MKIINLFFLLVVVLMASCTQEDELPQREYLGSVISPEVGGANEPNMVFVDLATATTHTARRDSWDLAFYCGNQFRVQINTSVYAAVGLFKSTADLPTTNLTEVTTATASSLMNVIAFGTGMPDNINYVDDFDGDINHTAIDEISINLDENKVYLLNLGYEVPNSQPATGSVEVAGNHRGWKKIRILRVNGQYVLHYANLDDTTYKEAIITKNTDYNAIFFSFTTETEVTVEPPKNMWDLCFTVFTNQIPDYGTYGYTDFILTNVKQNVMSYKVAMTNDSDYYDFNFTDIKADSLKISQRTIGSSWRQGGGPTTQPAVLNNRFYIVKDTENQYYKLRFMAITNSLGVRGYPLFINLPLQE